MYLVCVLAVAVAIISIIVSGKQADVTRDVYNNMSGGSSLADQASTSARIAGIVGGVVYLLGAIGFGVLAVLTGRGANPARIITWVFSGLGALCCCIGSVATGAAGSITDALPSQSSTGFDIKAATKQINDALPSWRIPVSITIDVLGLLALILVIILLALRGSNEFFKPAVVAVGHGDVPYPTMQTYQAPPGYSQEPPYPQAPPPSAPPAPPQPPDQPYNPPPAS
jgi:hypothetical protein